MDITEIIINSSISFGASLAAIIVSLWIERERQPYLRIIVEERANEDIEIPHMGGRWKFFRVRVICSPFPYLFRWIPKYTAQNCSAEIKFTRVGLNAESTIMHGRWASTPELANLASDQHTLKISYPDPVSIIAGSSEILDVFAKFENDKDAFGWNNESYLNNWRTPRNKLQRGNYKVTISLLTQNGRIFREELECRISDKIEDTYLKDPLEGFYAP